MPTDALLDLADDLVEALDDLAASLDEDEPPFVAAWSADPYLELADGPATKLWVVDHAVRSLTEGGVPIEEYELLLVLQRRLDADDAEGCRTMAALAGAIADFCRGLELDPDNQGNGAVCVRCERQQARDFESLHERGLFRAAILTTWRRTWPGNES